MHVLLATVGTAGDVHPFIGLGLVLQARGHRVTLLTNEFFRPLAHTAGLEFFALGEAADYEKAVANPDFFGDSRKGLRVCAERLVAPALRPLYQAIQTQHVPGKTVVAASSMAFGARIAQDRLGVPVATVHLQPTLLRTAYDIPVMPTWLPRTVKQLASPLVDLFIDSYFAEAVNAVRREVGLAPVKRILGQWVHSPQRILGLFPEWYAPMQPDWPAKTRLTGFPLYDGGAPLPPALSAFLDAGEPPLVFTAGTGMHHAAEFFRVSAEVCPQLGRRGILLSSSATQIPACLPSDVRHFIYAPFSRLLPRAAALIHHGGIGTTAQAFAAGTPQLIVPQAFDQPDSAARVSRLGTGLSLQPSAYATPAVIAKLQRLFQDEGLPERCAALARKTVTGDPLAEACNWIEELQTSPSKTQ